MQKIKDGNYYILVELLAKSGFSGSKQWEIASVSGGHIRWLNLLPRNISLSDLIKNKTPMIEIPAPDKLKMLCENYQNKS